MAEATDSIPDFPLFECDGLEAAFGSDRGRYLPTKTEGSRVERLLRDEAKAAAMLFYKGGALGDYGFKVRDGISTQHVYRCLSALLKSFDCSHEQKMGTAALAIRHWCEPLA